MKDDNRQPLVSALTRKIENEYYSFDAIQLIRVIKEILNGGNSDNQSRIFFETDPSLAFSPSDVSAVKFDGNNCTVSLPMMNLLGSSSPLPIKFTDHITRGLEDADTHRDFLSIMQNRLHALWISAYQKHTLPLGLFSRRTRSAADLKLLLKSTWKGIVVRIEENVARQTRIDNRRPLGSSLRLGRNSAAGAELLDYGSKFRVSIGPLDYDMYKSFLPGESNYRRFQKTIAQYLNEPLICELEILCSRQEFKTLQMGKGHEDGNGRLGHTAVLGQSGTGKGVHRFRKEIYAQ